MILEYFLLQVYGEWTMSAGFFPRKKPTLQTADMPLIVETL
jgi:hypothetical protein